MKAWLRRLRNTVRRSRLDRDIERELSFHLAELTDELRARGMGADEASRTARARLGDPFVQADRARDVNLSLWLDATLRNVRYAARSCRRAPGFSATVVLTLAVGIGANTAVFSAIDAVLLSPLPVPEGDRLVRVLERHPAESDQPTQIAPGRLEEWASRSRSLEALTGYYLEDVSDTTGPLPERIRRAVVSPRFLDVWRVQPALGRDFSDLELRAGGTPAVLVSDRYWRTRLGADPDVLTRVVRIEGTVCSIAGVMPATFRLPDPAVDVWWPYPSDGPALDDTPDNRRQRWYTGVARLKAGVTPGQVQADLGAVQAALATDHPQTDTGIVVSVAPLKQAILGNVGDSLWLLYGAVSILLVVACTNIASLWLSRAARRSSEVQLRISLGASRRSIAAQLLVETALLTGVGTALGLAVASAASGAIHALMPDLPRRDEIGFDGRVLLYTIGSAFFVTLACGLLPACRVARTAASSAGKERTVVGSRSAVQRLLVGAQMALATVLLVGAGLLVRSADAVSRLEPGFDRDAVLVLRVSGNWAEAADRTALAERIERTMDHLGGIAGVEAVATSWSLPGLPRRYQTEFTAVDGRPASEPALLAEWRSVSPAYFDVLRIGRVAGERCRPTAASSEGTEIVVNERFARRYFGGRSAIGAGLAWESGSLRGRIVGVVRDVREGGLDRDAPPTVYACDSAPSPFPWFLLRTQGDPASVAGAVRSRLKETDPLRSVYDMAPLRERIDDAYAQARARTSLLVLFASTAVLLACLGVYATLAHAVASRRREMGLRLALGANRRGLVGHVAGQALRVVGVGCAAGVAVSLAARSAVAGVLVGVSPSDPITLGAAVAVILSAATVAALVPAIRGTSVEPMRVLREP